MTAEFPFDLARPYGLDRRAKAMVLLPALSGLVDWHRDRCLAYANVLKRQYPGRVVTSREDVPFLPVRLFKSLDLRSVPQDEVIRTLTSSGTSGQAVSRIALDRETALRQTRVLAAIVTEFLGRKRRPMIVIDSRDAMTDRTQFSARAAAVLGFSNFGRDHFYCLDAALKPDFPGLSGFLREHEGIPVFAFGFTFLVWQALYEAAKEHGVRLNFGPGSVLLHGGGWKRLADRQVDNEQFKSSLRERFGVEKIFNYYGMVEQVGSIFMECVEGHLHCPVVADVVIRDPVDYTPLPVGREGLIQVLSALPLSYPGHSLLTEDLGTLLGEDDCACGRLGRYFRVSGRLPQAELRGCSDTRVLP
jgi:hypothetical protein